MKCMLIMLNKLPLSPLNWVQGSFLEVKRTEPEADKLPLSISEFRNGWSLLPLSHTSARHSGYLSDKYNFNFSFKSDEILVLILLLHARF
jgi:hypothetical protein